MHFLPCTSNYTQMSPLKLIVLMIENWMDLFMIILYAYLHVYVGVISLISLNKQGTCMLLK